MSIQLAIRHHTHYQYPQPISLAPQTIRLRPAPHARNPIRGYSLSIYPRDHFINWQQDPFGNYMARVVFPEKTDHFKVEVEVLVDMITINPFDFFLDEEAESIPFQYSAQLQKELAPYLETEIAGPGLQKWIDRGREIQPQPSVNFLVQLNQELCDAIDYTIRMEPGIQTCEETLAKSLGSCRDSAWVMVQLLRHLGLAARFVSGYLVQLTADEKPLEGPSGPAEDFTDLHAWAEVYLPGAGWIGLDVTSGLFAGEGHIPLAATPDPQSAAPISGFTEPTKVDFAFLNEVERIYERPRVSKPYSEDQWQKILTLGESVEKRLQEQDVRLTMGGEPTFVSIDDMESAQWNEKADGPEKRELAFDLAQKLKSQFAVGGFFHLGQGKWYPGEPIPRWQYALYWRKDGESIWQDGSLFADPNLDHGHSVADAERFLQALAAYLGVASQNVSPAYEDIYYFLWAEGNLPVGQDPLQANLTDSLERQTMAQILDRGLETPRGFVLPLAFEPLQQDWRSTKWQFRREHLYLLPGNSAMGVRLPLDRLPPLSPDEIASLPYEPSPLETGAPLAFREAVITKIQQQAQQTARANATWVRTALCAEIRDGSLHLFLPPLPDMQSSLELLTAIEQTASDLQLPVILEGYQPPFDARIQKLVVAPDPGVIEVNIHPARQWSEIVNNYEHLFEAARLSRLGTEKFMLDGKHTGTGGGNHITLGGEKPLDSPFLRRPDLLRSFVNFWQNHPGLSYLFSSAFVGPTSQAPRVDEGRSEALYELEIAFRELDRHDDPPPWLVDRLFRNLLIDLTGNTHRAEFCIDKLYSPDSQSGRLGILEMRGFDMPPHRQMCLTQILLIRALTLAFWERPYRQKLVRWGTELHDRFMIHHYVQQDLEDVIHYLQEAGIPFEMDWLAPFCEFRFPILGQLQLEDVHLEIRAGIEAWNVLGEEMSQSGTARFVDSSVERIQIKVSGIKTERYQLLCNQTVVPLSFTGTNGQYVAGIRYKAWNPPSALHPTVGVDVPLVFDLYDSWNERSI
ncbi:MAG: transglutaminase family protein, partial [Bacteroidota bacterium]